MTYVKFLQLKGEKRYGPSKFEKFKNSPVYLKQRVDKPLNFDG